MASSCRWPQFPRRSWTVWSDLVCKERKSLLKLVALGEWRVPMAEQHVRTFGTLVYACYARRVPIYTKGNLSIGINLRDTLQKKGIKRKNLKRDLNLRPLDFYAWTVIVTRLTREKIDKPREELCNYVKRELKKVCRSEKNPQQGPATFLTDIRRWNSAIGELWIRRSHPPAVVRRPEQKVDRNY